MTKRSVLSLALVVQLLAVAGFPVRADDFDAKSTIPAYYVLRQECRIGEGPSGWILSQEESAAACEGLNALGIQIKSHGYCWDKPELVWRKCRN